MKDCCGGPLKADEDVGDAAPEFLTKVAQRVERAALIE
jgi:hypothetical protein